MNIKIYYHNELYLRIETEKSIEYDLRDEFSFFANNYKHMSKFKYGVWDGKIRLYNSKDKTLYIGLLSDLYSYAKKNGITITINDGDKEKFKPLITYDEKWIDDVFHPNMFNMTLKDYQLNSFKEITRYNKVLVLSPTGSGKSALIYTLVRYLIDIDIVNSNNRLLINVPSITLVNQLYQDFIDYTKDNFDISKYITRAGGDNTEELKLPVVISTWQTTMRKDDSYFENIVAYVLDEAHQATANEITKIIDKMPFCKIRIGTTGTLDGTDMHEMAMRGRFGKLYQAATSKELMERGDLTKLSIDAHILNYDEKKIKELYKNIKSLDPTQKYQSELEFIINNDVRTKYLIDLAFSYEENTLMLFNFIEKHGKKMLDIMLPLQDKNLRRVYFIYGGVKGDEREIIRTTLDKKPPVWYDLYISENEFIRIRGEQYIVLSNGENISGFDLKLMKKYEIDINWIKNKISSNTIYFNINDIDNFSNKVIKIKKRVGCSVLLASYGTLAVGVNIKNLHNLIFCHPVKSQIRLLQSIGRVLRKCNNKNLVNVIDIVDNMTYKTKKKEHRNTLIKQFVERLKIYDNQEFDYNIQKVEL